MEKKIIETTGAPAPIGPYKQAVLVNGTLYVSGQIALDAATNELVKGSVADETHMVMRNIGAILAEAGCSFDHVVKTTIFLTDMGRFAELNEVYGTYFRDSFPARETVQVAALPKGVQVEISVIAVP